MMEDGPSFVPAPKLTVFSNGTGQINTCAGSRSESGGSSPPKTKGSVEDSVT